MSLTHCADDTPYGSPRPSLELLSHADLLIWDDDRIGVCMNLHMRICVRFRVPHRVGMYVGASVRACPIDGSAIVGFARPGLDELRNRLTATLKRKLQAAQVLTHARRAGVSARTQTRPEHTHNPTTFTVKL